MYECQLTVLGKEWLGLKPMEKTLRDARRRCRIVVEGHKYTVAVRIRRSDGRLFGL